MTGPRIVHSVPTAAEIASAAWEGRPLVDGSGRPITVWLFDVVDIDVARALLREADDLLKARMGRAS